MLIEQFIANVKESLGVSTDDTRVRNRHVYSVGKSVRSELLRQELNKDYLWNGGSAQLLPSLELMESTISENIQYQAGIRIYKSCKPIPKLLDTIYGKVILNVYFDNGQRLERVEYSDWVETLRRRYKLQGNGYYFLRNDHLYVVEHVAGECIILNIEAIWEEPDQVGLCSDACGYVALMDFGMPGYLERRIIEITAETVRRKYIIAEDRKNDGREEVQLSKQ